MRKLRYIGKLARRNLATNEKCIEEYAKIMTSQQEFWKWFSEHEGELFDFEADQERTFDRLASQLKKIDSNLTFEFGPKRDAKREFVISAGGIKRAFSA